MNNALKKVSTQWPDEKKILKGDLTFIFVMVNGFQFNNIQWTVFCHVPIYFTLEILKVVAYCNLNAEENLTCSEYAHLTLSNTVCYSILICVIHY